MLKLSAFILGTVSASLVFAPVHAPAETIQRTIVRGKTWGYAVGAYDKVLCGNYPVHNVHIAEPPAHGVAQVMVGMAELGTETGVCKGMKFKAPMVVYKPSGKYTGPDHLTVKWMAPVTTEAVKELEQNLDVEFTIK
jgi:hypothetical protein